MTHKIEIFQDVEIQKEIQMFELKLILANVPPVSK